MVKKPSVKVLPEKKEVQIKKKNSVIKEKTQIIQEPVLQKIKSEDVKREHLFMFMTKNGTTNKKIQEIILQKCIDRVGEDDNKLLFKELYNYYKNKNGVN
mgnify:CR=1 FL=1